MSKPITDFFKTNNLYWFLWDPKKETIHWDRMNFRYILSMDQEGLLDDVMNLQGVDAYVIKHLQDPEMVWTGSQRTLINLIRIRGLVWFNQYASGPDIIQKIINTRDSTPRPWNAKRIFFENHAAIYTNRILFNLYCKTVDPETCSQKLMALTKSTDTADMIYLFDSTNTWAMTFPEHARVYKRDILKAIKNPKSLVYQGLYKCVGKPQPFPDDKDVKDALLDWFDCNKPQISNENRKHEPLYSSYSKIIIEHSFLRGVAKEIVIKTDNDLSWLKTHTYLGNDPDWRKKVWAWIKNKKDISAQEYGVKNIIAWVFSSEASIQNWSNVEKQRFEAFIALPEISDLLYGMLKDKSKYRDLQELMIHACTTPEFLYHVIHRAFDENDTYLQPIHAIYAKILEGKPAPEENQLCSKVPSEKDILICSCIRVLHPTCTISQAFTWIQTMHAIKDITTENSWKTMHSMIRESLKNIVISPDSMALSTQELDFNDSNPPGMSP